MLLMQAGDYLRAMNWHNKFASYFASLQGSGSDNLGLQGGSNINAVWSSELADVAICFDVCVGWWNCFSIQKLS